MKFKIWFHNGYSAIVDKVIVIQDGEEKLVAFPEMKYSPNFRITEYKEKQTENTEERLCREEQK